MGWLEEERKRERFSWFNIIIPSILGVVWLKWVNKWLTTTVFKIKNRKITCATTFFNSFIFFVINILVNFMWWGDSRYSIFATTLTSTILLFYFTNEDMMLGYSTIVNWIGTADICDMPAFPDWITAIIFIIFYGILRRYMYDEVSCIELGVSGK